MASLRQKIRKDYKILHEGEPLPKTKTYEIGKVPVFAENYYVERIITRRHQHAKEHEFEYLVKWQDFHVSDSTWEPESHLQQALTDNYIPTQLSKDRIKNFSESFEILIRNRLHSNNPLSSMCCDLDIFRFMTGTSESKVLLNLQDFNKFELPEHWYYELGKDGYGRKIKFPIRMSARVHMRKMYIKVDGQLVLKSSPVERVSVFCCTEGCSFSDI